MEIRDYKSDDAAAINDLAVKAFSEYSDQYDSWQDFSDRLRNFSFNASHGELMVATINEEIVGAVGYIPAQVKKPDHFPKNTPSIKMLVVAPEHRGLGLGKKLTQECIDRAVRDNCSSISLHTSPIMKIALPMYERMGFKRVSDAPDISGVKYDVYIKELA